MSTIQDQLKGIIETFNQLTDKDSGVSIMLVTTIGDPEDKAYNYNFYVSGDIGTIQDALINQISENALEGDGEIYQTFKEIIEYADEIIGENISTKVVH